MSSSEGGNKESPQRRDSSPDSRGLLPIAFYSGFEFKQYRQGRRVRSKDSSNVWTPIWEISSMQEYNDIDGLSNLSGLDQLKAKQGAKNWTTFFLNHEVWLRGDLDCANLLKDREPNSAVYVKADGFFPYYQNEDRVVKGKILGPLNVNSWVIKAHLDNSENEIDLRANVLYLISGDLYKHVKIPRRCAVCNKVHDIRSTPCPQLLMFMSTNHFRCPQEDVDVHLGGDPVLTIDQGKSKLRSAGFQISLCGFCKNRAKEGGNTWFRLDGLCDDHMCLNSDPCGCIDDPVDCADFVYIDCCEKNNLPSNSIAAAIEDGTVLTVVGARHDDGRMYNRYVLASRMIIKAMKNGLQISVADVAKEARVYEEELLSIAMYFQKLGDYIKGNKCFTLSVVNGYVENDAPRAVGPWLVGRIAKDRRGQMWHVPKREAITVETRDRVSHIQRSRRTALHCSDALGDFIAGFGGKP